MRNRRWTLIGVIFLAGSVVWKRSHVVPIDGGPTPAPQTQPSSPFSRLPVAVQSGSAALVRSNHIQAVPFPSAKAQPLRTARAAINDLPAHTRAQISALQEAKSKWTVIERKLDTHLLHAEQIRSSREVAPGVRNVRFTLETDSLDRVAVDIDGEVKARVLKSIRELGGEVVRSFEAYGKITALVPLSKLKDLAAIEEIRFIEPAVLPFNSQNVRQPDRFETGRFMPEDVSFQGALNPISFGTQTSQGDAAHAANKARATYGVTGAGVKVGVLSDSVRYLARSQTAGELPAVTVLPGQDGIDLPVSPPDHGEGTAMLEIIHDLAPGAELFFATATSGVAGFATNILRLRAAGCDVIVDDVGYGSESPFQDDIIAQAVNAVTADGAVYVSSAGNSGNSDQETSTTWEGDFQSAGPISEVPRSGQIHNFGNGQLFNSVTNHTSAPRFLNLTWADPLGRSRNDYDLYVIDTQGNVVDYSLRTQSGTQNPSESLPKISSGDRILIVLASGEARYLRLACRGRLAITTPGAIYGHACAADALAVAAIRSTSSYPNPFDAGIKNRVETFSSDGPRRMFFSAAGVAVTPGNFSSSGGVVRQKPDLAGADGVSTSVPMFLPFYGTSAAAPHVAAVAALLKSFDPTLTGREIREVLIKTALRPSGLNHDRNSGFGIAMADRALASLVNPTRPIVRNLSATEGIPDALITLFGTNLHGLVSVEFAGQKAEIVSQSSDQITVKVPPGISSGFVLVRTDHGAARSMAPFRAIEQPVIRSFDPLFAALGTTVTVSGTNFLDVTSVLLNGTTAPQFQSVSATELTFVVPSSASTGPITIATAKGTGTTTNVLTIVRAPTVQSFIPNQGAEGDFVWITGTQLGTARGVEFGGVLSTNLDDPEPTEFFVVVPPNAQSGPLTIITEGGSITTTGSFTVLPRPANDAFAAAETISGDSGSVFADNTGASKESDEPSHGSSPGGKSVWYRWTAPANGFWTFEVFSRKFDTVIGIYTGTVVSGLNTVGGNDDTDGGQGSRATFYATEGVTYQIAVDGFYYGEYPSAFAEAGPFTLSWTMASVTPVITGFEPPAGSAGAQVLITGRNLNRVTTVRLNGFRAAFTAQSENQILAVVPAGANTAPWTVVTPAGTFSSRNAFQVNSSVANDSFSDAVLLEGLAGSVSGANNAATRESAEPNPPFLTAGRSVWYRWVAPTNGPVTFNSIGSSVDTTLAVFSGTNLQNLQLVTANDDGDGTASVAQFTAVPGSTYFISLDGGANDNGRFILSWAMGPRAPAITSFSPHSGRPGDVVTIAGRNFSLATEVQFAGTKATSFTINSDRQITAVVPSAAQSGLLGIATPETFGVSGQVFVVEGRTPANDAQSSAVVLREVTVNESNNIGATMESFELDNNEASDDRSVWYQWTAASGGAWEFEVSARDFQPRVQLYDAAVRLVSTALSVRRSNTDRVRFVVSPGQSIFVRVSGKSGGSGLFTLQITPSATERTIYRTRFDTLEGFLPQFTLRGQGGWTGTSASGNAIASGIFSGFGNQAIVGADQSVAAGDTASFWTPFTYSPILANNPLLHFSVLMQVSDSRTSDYDTFGWSVRDRSGVQLFAVLFDNIRRRVGYSLGTSDVVIPSGIAFDNFSKYSFRIAMNLAANRWSAWLGDNLIATDQPISDRTPLPNIGRIAAIWRAPSDRASASNFMVFDEYTITERLRAGPDILTSPQSQTLTIGTETQLRAVAIGLEPLHYQWTRDGRPIAGATNSLLHLYRVAASDAGNYALTVTNVFGTATSDSARIEMASSSSPRLQASAGSLPLQIHLTLSGTAGATYMIQSSTNLLTWTDWRRITLNDGSISIDVNVSNTPSLFYRAMFVP